MEKTDAFLSYEVWWNILGIVIISTVAAYILYTHGLVYIESSKAAILAAMEPIVAVLVGVMIYGDSLNQWQVLGIVLVISSAFVTVYHKQRKLQLEINKFIKISLLLT